MQGPGDADEASPLARLERVILVPDAFKARLGVGADSSTSFRLIDNLQTIQNAIGGGVAGASIASSGVVATTFFSSGSLLSAIGVGAAVTPVGWVVAAAIGTAGATYGVTRLLKKASSANGLSVPKFINTPLDLLGASLLDFILPLSIRVAEADGHVSEAELEEIYAHLIENWGYDPEYVSTALKIHINANSSHRLDELARSFNRFTAENPDCNIAAIRNELSKILHDVARADGEVTEIEEMVIDRVLRA